MISSRFDVQDGEIVDLDTRTIISPEEFNTIATPEDRDLIGEKLGSLDLLESGPPSVLPEAPDETDPPAQGNLPPESEAPSTKKPTLDEFMTAAREANPGMPDRKLRQHWAQHYSDIDPKTLPTLDVFMQKAKDANPTVSPGKLRKYWEEHYGDFGAAREAPPERDFMRGAETAVKQIPQLAYGLEAGAGAVGEKIFGEGGVATKIKEHGIKNYQEASAGIEKESRPSDSATKAWEMAKEGNPGALVDFLQYGLGYMAVQAGEMVATGGAGYIVGKLGAQGAAKLVAEKLIAKEAAKLAAGTAVTEAITKQAVANVAAKIGQTTALAATAVGMEGGEIFGDLTAEAQKEGRTLSGEELAKALGYTLAAGSLEFVGDKIGFDLITGKGIGRMAGEAAGLTGRAARGLLQGGAGAVAEGGTEFGQTLLEEAGKGKDPFSDQAIREAVDSAALGFEGGAVVGTGSGVLRGQKKPAPTVNDIMGATDVDSAITQMQEMVRQSSDLEAEEMALLEGRTPLEPLAPINEPSRTRQPFDVPILSGPTGPSGPGEQAIQPGQAFTPRTEPEPDPLEAIAAERARLIAGRNVPRDTIQEQDEVLAPSDRTDIPLQTAAEKAYTPGTLPTQESLSLRSKPVEKRPSQAPATVLDAPLTEDQTGIKPASGFTPRQVPELSPKERLAMERGRLVAQRRQVGANKPLISTETPSVPVEKQEVATAKPLPSAIDKAYPSVQDLHALAAEKGLDIESGTFREITKMVTGKSHLDDLTPQERQRFSNSLQKIAGKAPIQPVAKPKDKTQPIDIPTGQTDTEVLPVSDAAQLSRDQLVPEQNAELMARAEKAQADMEIAGTERGGRYFNETQGQGGDVEVTGLKSATASWYKDATSGPQALSRKRVEVAVEKILANKGRDVGKDVQRIKELLLLDREFMKSPFAPKSKEEWNALIAEATHQPVPTQGNIPPVPTAEGVRKEPEKAEVTPPAVQPSDVRANRTTETAPVQAEKARLQKKPKDEKPSESYRLLPAKTRTSFESALTGAESQDRPSIRTVKEWLDPGNKTLRAEFERRAGVKLPKGLAATNAAVEEYFKKPVPAAEAQPEIVDNKTENVSNKPAASLQFEPFSLTNPTETKPKAKGPEQTSIEIPPETVGSRPIIGREAQPEEAPLFSKAAQQPNDVQTSLPEQAPESPTEILANALRSAADQIEGKKQQVTGSRKPVKDKASTTLQDAGEKIGGARKDRWAERGLTLADLEDMTGGEEAKFIVKANIWKPDYVEMVKSGTEPKAAALVKIVYDRLAAKPEKDTPDGRRNYLTMMGYVKEALGSVKTVADAQEVGRRIRHDLVGLPKPNAMGRTSRADREAFQPKYDIFWSAVKGQDPFSIGYREREKADKMLAEGFPAQAPWTRRYEIRPIESRGMTEQGAQFYAKRMAEIDKSGSVDELSDQIKQSGVYEIREKGSGRIVAYRLDRSSAEQQAQRLYENKSATEEGKEPVRPHLDELTREGTDYRNGRDVTAEDFRESFGFRGIEFGNYAASDERQKHVNQAYDALHDLADLLGIPPKAISLNGTLGLAFGARGGGKAAAHYEPSKLVINITKINGPGALAHEWGHALDHYFGELDRPDAYKGAAKGASGWYKMSRYTGPSPRLTNLRPEMSKAFDRVMSALFERNVTKAEAVRDAELRLEKLKKRVADHANSDLKELRDSFTIQEQEAGKRLAKLIEEERPEGGYGKVDTSFYKAAQTLSGSTGDYWKRPTEMFARSFESYVFDKLGGKSDYLVHGVEPDKFTKEKGYKENPYPAGVDREKINGAFNHLFDTMQSKETDQGVVLFEERGSGRDEPTMEQFEQAFRRGLPIGGTAQQLIDSSNEYPSDMMRQLSTRKYVRQLTHELNRAFETMKRVFVASDSTFEPISFAALSPDSYYYGVNLRGPDKVILNPWTVLDKVEKAVQEGAITDAQVPEYLAGFLVKTLIHEFTHQQVITTHTDERQEHFDHLERQNHAILGPTRLEVLQRQLMAVLTGGDNGTVTAIRTDLRQQQAFWKRGDGVSPVGLGLPPKPTYARRDQETSGEGASGRTGPPEDLRSRREVPPGSLDESPSVQRRGSYSFVTTQDARTKLAAAKTSVRPYLLGALGLQQISDVYGRDHHEVSDYNAALQTMQADFVQTTQVSDKILKDWDKLPVSVADQMAKVMEDARFANFDPDPVKAQAAITPAQEELKRRFRELPDDAKAVYRSARDYYETLAQSRFEAMKERIERAGGSPENRRKLIDRLELAYEKTKAKVYFPFTRFGEHIVVAKKMEADRMSGKLKEADREVQAFSSPGDAEKFATQMRARGWTVKQTTSKQYSLDRDGGASKAVREILDIVDNLGTQDSLPGIMSSRAQLKDAINQSFLNSLPDMSYAKHFIHAKEVKGASRDALRSFAHSALHGAHHISRIRYADRLTDAVQDLDTRINETEEGDVTEARQVYNELVQRHNAILNPNTHPFSAWLGQMGFTMSLGGVVATGFTNMTQVPLITLPWLGSRYGFSKSAAELGKAYKDFLDPATINKDSLFDASKSDRLTAPERAMLEILQKRGRIDLTQTMDLSGRASQDNLSRVAKQTGSIQAKITQMLGFTFHAPEVANRQVTALATYRLARASGSTEGDAISKAEQAIVQTHFIYDSSNRPRYMSGNVLRVLTMFKQYSANVAYLYGRSAQVWLDKNNSSAEERAIAKKQLLSMLGLQFAAAGTLGLPFVGTVASLLTAVLNAFGDDDDKKDWEVELRKYLAETFGKDAGEVLSHGVSRLTPWDMAGRLGQADLFFRAPQKEREGRAAAMDWVTSFAGPVLGYAVNSYLGVGDVIKGLKSADAGHFLRGVEELSPSVLRHAVRTLRYETEGGVKTRDGHTQLTLDYAEKLGQFFGFGPSRVAEMYEGGNAIKNSEHQITVRRKELLDHYAAAIEDRDAEARRGVINEVREFNKKHPYMRINGDTLARSMQGRKNRERGTKGGVYLSRKREPLREQGAFANY